MKRKTAKAASGGTAVCLHFVSRLARLSTRQVRSDAWTMLSFLGLRRETLMIVAPESRIANEFLCNDSTQCFRILDHTREQAEPHCGSRTELCDPFTSGNTVLCVTWFPEPWKSTLQHHVQVSDASLGSLISWLFIPLTRRESYSGTLLQRKILSRCVKSKFIQKHHGFRQKHRTWTI